jgi:hypothetical protein
MSPDEKEKTAGGKIPDVPDACVFLPADRIHDHIFL